MSKQTYLIKTPNSHFNGLREGVKFMKGEARTPFRAEALRLEKNWGYTVEKVKPRSKKSNQENEPNTENEGAAS